MSRIFLTGSDGFVGRRLVPQLSSDAELLCLQRSEPSPGDATGVRGDLRDPGPWRAALAGCDTVVHLASITGRASPAQYFEVNLTGTEALVAAAREAGVQRFLYVSSIAVRFPDIRSYPYARSKLQAEEAVRASGLPFVVVRPTMVFGPQSPVQAGLRALARLPLSPLFDGGRARVQPIHVDDLARLVADVLRDDPFAGETLELGGRDESTVRDLVGDMREACGRSPRWRVDVPTWPFRPVLGLLERIDHRLAPISLGQLCSFRFDGVAEPNRHWRARRESLRSLAEMVGCPTPPR